MASIEMTVNGQRVAGYRETLTPEQARAAAAALRAAADVADGGGR